MSQFGGGGNKVPPWQRGPQLTSLLGQHPNVAAAAAAATIGQLVMAGQQQATQQQQQQQPPQQPQQQYAPVQQSMIQAPGLANLQTLTQQGLQQQTANAAALAGQAAPTTPGLVQNTLAQTSLMGQPPIATQPLQQLQQQQQQQNTLQQQQALQQQQQQQQAAQVAPVQYPTPRALAPPTTFQSIQNTLAAPPVMGLPPTSVTNMGGMPAAPQAPPTQQPPQQAPPPPTQQPPPPQKQRVFTGSITKLCADFGFVDDDVFFQTSCVIGQPPTVNDRVLVEATYNPTMPFKWNANRVQVIPGPSRDSNTSHRSAPPAAPPPPPPPRQSGGTGGRPDGGYNAVPPPSFASTDRRPFRDNSGSYNSKENFSSRSRRSRSPRRENRRDRDSSFVHRDRDDAKDTTIGRGNSRDNDLKRKRSRSRERTRSPRSPARRRPRVVPRYNVQVPKLLLQIDEANILELRKRYSNLYIPSDVFVTRPLWSNTFPANRPFPFPKPISFHIMHKDVDSVLPNDAVYDPPDVHHSYAAKVMLLSVPSMEDIYRRSCALSEDLSDNRDSSYVHPTRLINFCVGLKGKSETMAIGGHWSPSLDGPNPDKDPSVLIKTAIRTCLALTGIDLSPCTTWYRFAEIYYRRGESGSSSHKTRPQQQQLGGVGGSSSDVTGGSHSSNTINTSSSPSSSSTPPTTSSSGGGNTRVETTVLFLPDVWNIAPTKLEWDGLHLNYKRQLDRKLAALCGGGACTTAKEDANTEEDEDEDVDQDHLPKRKDPTHWSNIDIKNLKVVELRQELDARLLNSRGLRSQLIARLTKALKSEQEKEEADKAAIEEKMKTDESLKREEEDKRKEEEKRKRDEEEKKREEEEKRRNIEKEKALLEKRHTLPESPMILVHPSRSAKSGKFDATTMSLSVLLDYRQEDNKEHSFEVSLFAELFNEMLMRDFAFRIYRALVEAPDKLKDEDKKKEVDKEKKKDDDKERLTDKKEDADKDERREIEMKRDDDDGEVRKRRRRDKFKTENDQRDDEDEAILDLDFEYEEEEFFKEDAKAEEEKKKEEEEKRESIESNVKSSNDRSSRTESKSKGGSDRKRCRGTSSDRKDKRRMYTQDPYLLLAFIYFDTTRTGYIVDRDLEDIINLLGLNLSRAQLKKLTSKVVSRDVLHYRKLTDAPLDEKDKHPPPRSASPSFLELLAKGNRPLCSYDSGGVLTAKRPVRGSKEDQSPKLKEGVVRYEGSLVDVAKLMQQLQRSEKALLDTEDKLKQTQKELSVAKEEVRVVTDKNQRLSKEVKGHVQTSKSTEHELQRCMDDNFVYMTALNKIKEVIKPLVKGLEMDLDEDIVVKVENTNETRTIKTEDSGRTNGVSS